MALRALVVLAGEAVTSRDGVRLVAQISKLAVSVLAKLANGGHSDFLVYFFMKLSALSAANTRLTDSADCNGCGTLTQECYELAF